jgi:hypothetical protein
MARPNLNKSYSTYKRPPRKNQIQKTKPIQPPQKKFHPKTILNIFLIIILLISLAIFLYLTYLNIPGEPEKLEFKTQQTTQEETPTDQFFSYMKFNHNEISYTIDPLCNEEQNQRMNQAFNQISSEVPQLTFKKSQINTDIKISCSEQEKESLKEDFFIAGEGGAKEIIKSGKYNVITNGVILLFNGPKNSKKCDWPNIEIHELMHVFGFNHSENPNSLMYPYLESCEQKLDLFIIKKLKELYSEENLPDLILEDIDAIKKGRYLDFNITIRNIGTIDAKDISFSILDESEVIETKEFEELKYGAGIFLMMENLKLIHKNPDEITFIINKDNTIKEIDSKNNIAKIKLN